MAIAMDLPMLPGVSTKTRVLLALMVLAISASFADASDTGDASVSAGTSASETETVTPTETVPAPSYSLTIRLGDGDLLIEGAVRDARAKASLVSIASRLFPDLPLTTVITEDPRAPESFAVAAARSAELMRYLSDGEATISDGSVTVLGAAYHPKAYAALSDLLKDGWPDGYAVTASDVTEGPDGPILDAAACESTLRTIMEGGGLAFEAGRADVTADSRPLLDRIAYVALRCPESLIAVGGHTDSDGSHEKNYDLSLERARAVIDLLVADGLARDRFTALGYGESRPLASNGTLAGKARNRRIEFVLRD